MALEDARRSRWLSRAGYLMDGRDLLDIDEAMDTLIRNFAFRLLSSQSGFCCATGSQSRGWSNTKMRRARRAVPCGPAHLT